MRRITVLMGFVSLFLLLAMLRAPFVAPVAASQEIRMVPTLEYPTIQAAIDAANSGDTIRVVSGTYYEHLVVNKSLTIVGEGSSATIIDGNGTGIVVRIGAPDVKIRGFTVQNAGGSPNSSIHLGGCVGNTIRDNVIRNNAYGITLMRSNCSIIVGNMIMNNSWAGIHIRDSSNNIIHYNTIVNNFVGVLVTSESSRFNTFFHNNFIDNGYHASSFSSTTTWDNGAEGNYWDDYMGEDLDGDGIGETLLPHLGNDNFPLMQPWSPYYRVFSVNISEVTYYITTISNSTLVSFDFNQELKKISFNTTSSASGFCYITIPTELRDIYFVVLVDKKPALPLTLIEKNATHFLLYFMYLNGTHTVEILGRTAMGLLGDVNGDAIIDKLDISCVEMALFTYPGDPDYNPYADVNRNGRISAADLVIIGKHLYWGDC